MIERYANRNVRLSLAVLSAIIAIVSIGCGGDSSAPPAQPAAPRRLVQQPPQVDQKPAPAHPGPTAMGQHSPKKPEPKPKRDDDVSKWKTSDYLNAKKENDRRLLEAVQYVADNEKTVGNEKIASLLVKLLTAEEPEEKEKDDSKKTPKRRGMAGPGMEMGMGMGMPQGQPQASRLDRQTIETVITALTANDTKPAIKAIQDVVLGTLKTDDDTVATKAALIALAEDESPENEAVLFRALTEPEKLRPEEEGGSPGRGARMMPGMGMGRGYGASGKLSADELRIMVLEIVEPVASEDFRTKLAAHLLKPNMPTAVIRTLSDMLIKPHPSNVGPQLLLFQSEAPDMATKAKLAGFFTEYSETALAYLLGVWQHAKTFDFANDKNTGDKKPAKKKQRTGWGRVAAADNRTRAMEPGMGPGPMGGYGMVGYGNRSNATLDTKQLMASDAEMPGRVVQKLWSPQVAGLIGAQLAQVPSLDEAGLILPLARTMPVDDVRASLYRLMQTHWQLGSRPFLAGVKMPTAGGMGMGMGMEMGGMPAAGYGRGAMGMPAAGGNAQFDDKVCDPGFLVLIKMLPIDPKQNGGRKSRGGRPPAPGMGMPGAMNGSPIADWHNVHDTLLQNFYAAFEAAGRLNRDAQPAGTIPIELHTAENIETRFDLKWPGPDPNKSGKVLDPMEIHYVKISEVADPAKTLKSYSRILKVKPRMVQPNRVALLSKLKDSATPGNKLSLDVLITIEQQAAVAMPQPAGRKSRKSTGQPITVEILTIEMKDPEAALTKATAKKD